MTPEERDKEAEEIIQKLLASITGYNKGDSWIKQTSDCLIARLAQSNLLIVHIDEIKE